MELKELKGKYGEYEKKYGLPSFAKLNEQFEIEKIEKESDIFLRVVRKTMMDKIVNSLSFLDMLLNPINAPRVYLNYIKSMNGKDKELLDNVYGIFSELSLACLPLELEYGEKNEAEMINRIYQQWEKIRPDFLEVLNRVHKPEKGEARKERSYFG